MCVFMHLAPMISSGDESVLDGAEVHLYHNNPRGRLIYTVNIENRIVHPDSHFVLWVFSVCPETLRTLSEWVSIRLNLTVQMA